jgi:hypothetical protein
MIGRLLPVDEGFHCTDQNGRGYTAIGWLHIDYNAETQLHTPVLIPDEIALGEPLPASVELAQGRPIITRDGK